MVGTLDILLLHLQKTINKRPGEHKLLLAKHEFHVNELLVLGTIRCSFTKFVKLY